MPVPSSSTDPRFTPAADEKRLQDNLPDRLNPAATGVFRRTKIIFTIGPSTDDVDTLAALISEGVDICRFNMAHATHDYVRTRVGRVREASRRVGREIALLMDVKGPEIRTGPLDESIELARGDRIDFLVSERRGDDAPEPDHAWTTVNYPALVDDLKPGDTVLVDSGLMRFEVESVGEASVTCRVVIGGSLGSRRHINLPGVRVKLPSMTAKDQDDIEVGLELDFTFFALSFVREPEDLDIIKRYLSRRKSEARVIAKIEDQQAITNLYDIITASDGLMVARGDLGIECPYEELPIIQHRAVKTCINLGKPVIVATHMLESMMENPVPTRAEVSDVAQAVLELADCVMLSGETTTGKYPIECVQVMKRIAYRMERAHQADPNREVVLRRPKGKMLRAACYLSHELNDAGILVFTRGGYLAQRLSSLRPRSPIYAFTDDSVLFQRLLILWGVEPFHMPFSEDPEATIRDAFRFLVRRGWVQPGHTLLVITNILAGERVIDSLQIRTVET